MLSVQYKKIMKQNQRQQNRQHTFQPLPQRELSTRPPSYNPPIQNYTSDRPPQANNFHQNHEGIQSPFDRRIHNPSYLRTNPIERNNTYGYNYDHRNIYQREVPYIPPPAPTLYVRESLREENLDRPPVVEVEPCCQFLPEMCFLLLLLLQFILFLFLCFWGIYEPKSCQPLVNSTFLLILDLVLIILIIAVKVYFKERIRLLSFPLFLLWTLCLGYLVLHISCLGAYMQVVGEATAISIMFAFIFIYLLCSCLCSNYFFNSIKFMVCLSLSFSAFSLVIILVFWRYKIFMIIYAWFFGFIFGMVLLCKSGDIHQGRSETNDIFLENIDFYLLYLSMFRGADD